MQKFVSLMFKSWMSLNPDSEPRTSHASSTSTTAPTAPTEENTPVPKEENVPTPSSHPSFFRDARGSVGMTNPTFMVVAGDHFTISNEQRENMGVVGTNIGVEASQGFEGDSNRRNITRSRPPIPASQRDCDIYYRHMGARGRGSPLWLPEPNESLPIQYRLHGTAIGDLGIITEFGGFDFLFNVCLAHDHPAQSKKLPENFQPVSFEDSDVYKRSEFKHDSYLASSSIKTMHNNGDQKFGLRFESSASEGAILTMPVGSNSKDLRNVIGLQRYVGANAANWYKYVYAVRGRPVLNGDLRLVIGYDKSKAWGMATFANSTAQESSWLKFIPMDQCAVGRAYIWEASGATHSKAGPAQHEIEALRAADSLQEGMEYENQCLFVRTMNFTLPEKVWKEIVSESGLPVNLDASRSHFGSSSTPGHFRNGNLHPSASNFSHETQAEGGWSSRTTANNMPVSIAHFHSFGSAALAAHPSKAINEMLLRNANVDVRIVVTEDKDWISVLTKDDFTLPSAVDLCERVQASSFICEKDGIVFLEPKDNQTSISADLPESTPVPAPNEIIDTVRDVDQKFDRHRMPVFTNRNEDEERGSKVVVARPLDRLPVGNQQFIPNRHKGHITKDSGILILVLGQTGSGKSTFINTAAGRAVAEVHHSLTLSDLVDRDFVVQYPGSTQSLVLVDTPGFDHYTATDWEVLNEIVKWLRISCHSDVRFGGIIYISDITVSRVQKEVDMAMFLLRSLARSSSKLACHILIATTKWERTQQDPYVTLREQGLKDNSNSILDSGGQLCRLMRTEDSAWKIIDTLLSSEPVELIVLQRELEKIHRRFPSRVSRQHLVKKGYFAQIFSRLFK